MAKILVVDDNADNRRVLERLLAFGGHQATCAADGRHALDMARADKPDLVLMDLAMPEVDGWTATAAFKNDSELAKIPIIVVTGHLTSLEISRAREVGCQDVVSKPIDYYVLIAKIANHLEAA